MIQILRLVNGEILLGDVKELDTNSVSISKPASIQLQQVGPGQLGVGMIPYNPWATEDFVFFKESLLGPPNDVDEATVSGYNQRFNPDSIIVPPAPSLILE